MGIFVVITRGYAKVACYCIPEKLLSAFGGKANDCTFRGKGREMRILFVIEISIFLLTFHTTGYIN